MSKAIPTSRRGRLIASLGLVAIAAGLVAACGANPKTRVGICPRVAILGKASKVTKFAPGAAHKPQNVMYTAELLRTDLECRYGEAGDALNYNLYVDLDTTVIVRRGPAMRGDRARLRYFVIITDRRGTVLSKREFPVSVSFDGRKTATKVIGSWQFYSLKRSGTGLAYETWVGFQLSPAELRHNRKIGVE